MEWDTSIIQTLGRWEAGGSEFKDILGCIEEFKACLGYIKLSQNKQTNKHPEQNGSPLSRKQLVHVSITLLNR